MTDQNSPGDKSETTRAPFPPLEPYPATPPDGVAFAGPVQRSEVRSIATRVGILAGSAVLLLVGVVAAMGASPSPATGAGPSAAPDATAVPGASAPAGGKVPRGPLSAFGLPFGGGPGFAGGPGFGGFGLGGITVTAVDGQKVSLKTDDGWTRTITVTADTKITKGGATIAVGDLAAGDHVRIAQTRASDGTYTVNAIIVVLPSLAGQVSAIDGDTLTVTQPGGTTATIHVTGSTTYQVNGAPGALSDIKVGSFIVAEGAQRADGSLDAAVVRSGFGGRGVPGGPGFGPSFGGGRHGQGAPKGSPAPSSGAS
jgi:Domain of unknown function (DUF5666)